MIDIRTSRHLAIEAHWAETETDLDPTTAAVIAALQQHDESLRSTLRQTGAWHLLYDRWLRLTHPIPPRSEHPFIDLATACADLGFGLSVALTLDDRADYDEKLGTISRVVTEIEFHLPNPTAASDHRMIEATDLLANGPAALVLAGEIRRYRGIGATRFPSLIHRPHRYIPGKSVA